MTRLQSLCAALLAASITACTTTKVGYDYDPGANFNAYHTYAWVVGTQEKTGDRRVDSPDVDIRIRTVVGAQLHGKGYSKSQSGQPDFYVAYHVGINHLTADQSTQYISEGMPAHPFTYSADTRTMGKPHPEAHEQPSYTTGALLIDIIDAASKKLVWRGTASGEVDPSLTSEERDERIRGLVHEMFTHFPPK